MTRRPEECSPAELEADGWQRGCIADRDRIPDLIEMYQEIGHEVVLLPVPLDDAGCTQCIQADPERFRILYTRRRG